MKKEDEITLAGLLHDVGKIVQRASNEKKTHQEIGAGYLSKYNFSKQIVDSAKYHHSGEDTKTELKVDNAEYNSFAYIVYFADNIASGIDRRDLDNKKGGKIHCCLKSVYNLLNNNTETEYYNNVTSDKISKLHYPTNMESEITKNDYAKLVSQLSDSLENVEQLDINSILELLERLSSYVPSRTATNDTNDISLYDHFKLTAGLSLSLYKYLEYNNIIDYSVLKKNESKIKKEKIYLLASIDISGIQKFIYSIPSENALKQLRARSIYIDFLCENLCEEIINTLDLNKTVLLYNGGGHAYFVLPNTEEVKEKFNKVVYEQNEWLLKNFREKLYINSAYVECSSLDLLNKDKGNKRDEYSKINVFGKLYEQLHNKIQTNNVRRYTFNQIKELNSLSHQDIRECEVCGMSIRKNDRCDFCNSLTMLGDRITSKNGYILTTENLVKDNLNIKLYSEIYGNKYIQLSDIEDEQEIVESHIIGKKKINFLNSGNDSFENFQLANYYARNENFQLKTFEDFERESIGIDRLAFFRADIDDLGKAFKDGFKREEDYKYQTLSRFATLSRSLSRFFKMYISELCTNKEYMLCHAFIKEKENRNLTIIYSGGDDISVVGSYDEIIEFASDIYEAFRKYCGSTMTISAGIGLYKSGYPVSKMALETGDLLRRSKNENGKDSITLFNDTREYTFKWRDFIYSDFKDETNVLSRLQFVKQYFSEKGNLEVYGGKSFIYKIIECLRNGKEGIVRLAYTLGRLLNGNDNDQDKKFVNSIYNSSKDDKKRKAYIMALTLYVYSIREN